MLQGVAGCCRALQTGVSLLSLLAPVSFCSLPFPPPLPLPLSSPVHPPRSSSSPPTSHPPPPPSLSPPSPHPPINRTFVVDEALPCCNRNVRSIHELGGETTDLCVERERGGGGTCICACERL